MGSSSFKIAGRPVGDGAPCFIIAEAGSNHDGSLEQALRLVDAAAEAGADAVKFQNFKAERLYPPDGGSVAYLKKLGIRQSVYSLIKSMEMPYEWIPKLAARAKAKRILFLSTPFDEESADRLAPHVPAFKIASYEMTHQPLILHCASKGKPLIVSTGGADLGEVDEMVRAARASGAPLALMQCTAKYPAPLSSLNLRTITLFKERYGVPVGLSDHSREPVAAPVAAVGLGANLIEKHFTLSNRLPGPDHSYAVEPDELKETVRQVRAAESALGSGLKLPDPVEKELREYRRGVFTVKPVPKGGRLTASNTALLRRAGRRATGLEPRDYPSLLGRRAARRLAAFTLLAPADVEP